MNTRFETTLRFLLVLAVGVAGGCDSPAGPENNGSIDAGQAEDGGLFVQRGFRCKTEWMDGERTIGAVDSDGGSELVVTGTDEPCWYEMKLRTGDGEEFELVGEHGAGYYLIAHAIDDADDRVVCASNIIHSESGEERRTENVTIECAIGDEAGFSPMRTVVDPEGDWAAWLLEVRPVEDSDAYDVFYMHDFSFQFANIADEGRPEEDGIYSVRIRRDGDTLEEVSREKFSDKLVPADSIEITPWNPTPEERQAKGLPPRDDGDCPPPDGCPAE